MCVLIVNKKPFIDIHLNIYKCRHLFDYNR